MQNFDVLGSESFFLLNTPLRVIKQGIGSSICLALLVIDPEVVTRELLGLANLSGAQTFCLHELSEVVMVGKHKNFMLGAFQVMPPSLEKLNDG